MLSTNSSRHLDVRPARSTWGAAGFGSGTWSAESRNHVQIVQRANITATATRFHCTCSPTAGLHREERSLSSITVKTWPLQAEPIWISLGYLKMERCCKQSMLLRPNSSVQSSSSRSSVSFLNHRTVVRCHWVLQESDHPWTVLSPTALTGSRARKLLKAVWKYCGKLGKV